MSYISYTAYNFVAIFPSVLSLKALDNHVISDEEIVENLHLTGSFQPLTQHFRLQLYKLSPKVRS